MLASSRTPGTASAAPGPPRAGSPAGLCLGCDYPLDGLAGSRCPECGRAFVAGDPSTVNLGRPLGRLGQWVLRPVPWAVVGLALVPAAWLLWVTTDPQLYYAGLQVLVPALACIAVVAVQFAWWATRNLILLRRRQSDALRPTDRGRWKLVWAVMATSVVLVLLEVPLRVAFLAHRSALERVAAEVRADAPSCATLPGRRVGIYTLGTWRPAERNEGAVMLRFGQYGSGGFAHSPAGEAELLYTPGKHRRLAGVWYWFSED